MKIAPSVLAALAVILALLVARECGRREGKHTALATQRDRRDDSTVSRLVYEAAQTGQRMARERDSTGRVIRRLRAQIAPRDSIYLRPERGDSAGIYTDTEQLAVRDSLIDVLTSGRQQDSLQILFWRAAVASRDTVIAQLQASRDGWRAKSSRRLACVGGPSVTAGVNGRVAYGLGLTCGFRL